MGVARGVYALIAGSVAYANADQFPIEESSVQTFASVAVVLGLAKAVYESHRNERLDTVSYEVNKYGSKIRHPLSFATLLLGVKTGFNLVRPFLYRNYNSKYPKYYKSANN